MSVLEEIRDACSEIEDRFEHKSILFIGSESYDGPTITVLQGLEELGFDIYTIGKDNINSWFCNVVINDPTSQDYDFVLSNLHWGTRWSHYDRYALDDIPRVLIDGDDNPWLCEDWRCKHRWHSRDYEVDPPAEIKDRELMPYRWVEPIGNYRPEIVFRSHKLPSDSSTIYLPFGIQREYLRWTGERSIEDRRYDLTHVKGPGKRRRRMSRLVTMGKLLQIPKTGVGILPGKIFNGTARGREIKPDPIQARIDEDDNVHSYHRWVMYEDYFNLLQNSKILVMPGIDDWPGWENKRHYEAMACGCVILWLSPPTDISEYPMTDLFEYALCDSYQDIMRKYQYLIRDSERLEEIRQRFHERALKYFTPQPIARYFLANVAERI